MRHTDIPDQGQANLISASELASYAYCPEQWRLEHGLGLSAANHLKRAAGTRHHTQKSLAERLAGRLIACGQLLAVFALLGLIAWLWLR